MTSPAPLSTFVATIEPLTDRARGAHELDPSGTLVLRVSAVSADDALAQMRARFASEDSEPQYRLLAIHRDGLVVYYHDWTAAVEAPATVEEPPASEPGEGPQTQPE